MSSLHYTRMGNNSSETTVLVHGFMGSGADFQKLIAPCLDNRQFVLVDLPGHGDSVELLPEGRPANLEWMGEQLAEMVAMLPEPQIDLMGYSMGGRVALYMALHHAKQVRSLTLMSASPGISDEQQRNRRCELDAERARRILGRDFETFLHDWYGMELFAGLRDSPGYQAMLNRRMNNDRKAVARVIEEMSPGAQPDLWPRLETLDVPSTWIAGDEDRKYVDICRRAAAPSGGNVEIIDGVGHAVHVEAPQWFRDWWQSA